MTLNVSKPIALAFGIACSTASITAASVISWDGSESTAWTTGTNWTGDVAPGDNITSDIARFDLASYANQPNSGTISVGGVQIGSASGGLTLGGTSLTLGSSGIAVESGAAAATLSPAIALGASQTWTNQSSSLLTITGGASSSTTGTKVLTITGSGDTAISGAITAGSGAMNLLKLGTGTLTLSGGGALGGGSITAYAGNNSAVLLGGTTKISNGSYTSAGEFVVGGVLSNGGAGVNTNFTMDGGSLAISAYLSLGRGNGIGGVSSDIVLNNNAGITAGNFSAGFDGGNTSNKPMGTFTFNNTSSVSITSNGAFNLAESAGSSVLMTLNDSSAVSLAGTNNGRVIGNLGTGTLTLNGNSSFSNSGGILSVGYQTGTGVINQNGGTFTHLGELRVGANAANTTAAGTGTVNVTAGTMELNSLTVARNNDGTGKMSGTFNQSGGTVNVNTGNTLLGWNGDRTGAGTLNLTGGAFNAKAGNTLIGSGGGRGVLGVNGGTFTTVNDMVVAENGASVGSVTLDSGTIHMATTAEKWLKVNGGSTGNATFTVNGGTLNLNTNTDIRFTTGTGATGTNTFTLNGGLIQGQTGNANGVASLASVLDMNNAATGAANNTFNLNGGTLLIGQVLTTQVNNAGGSRIFNFNGGTLKAAGTTTSFFNLGTGTGTAYANVRNGGAIIDTNGNNVTIGQALVHSTIGGDSAIDGGLAKVGSGTLTLSGANTYNGATTVSAGTLKVTGSIGNSAVSVTGSGAVLASGATGTIGHSVAVNSGAVLAAGDLGAVGKATVTTSADFKSGSIFSWDLGAVLKDDATGAARGTDFDAVNLASLADADANPATNNGAIFRVVLSGSQTFADTFWSVDRSWAGIFKTADAGSALAFEHIFSSFQFFNGGGSIGNANPTGRTFSISGDTLVWSAVPEPGSALAGLLVTAGLIRRRRTSVC